MTTVDVFLDDAGATRLAGVAHFTRNRGRVSTTFLYAPEYLVGDGMSIDPALPLVSGAQHQNGLVRAFADSAPDRWGRNIIEKAERNRARDEGRAVRRLDDVDFLLGVSDDARQGALRFRLSESDDFVGDPAQVPQLVSLPELLRASDDLAAGDDSARVVKQLLHTGTTGLGGARPKAAVRLEDGSLAIAKFPHSSDRWDVMAWEATALDLLEACGIAVPQRRLTRVGNRGVLVLRRFDRSDTGARIGYISGMTATEAADGEQRDYADIAAAIRDISRSPRKDHHELFDRVSAGITLGNTDDHLRNHGFLSDRGFWTLSPAFDVNPNPDLSRSRSTSIAGADAYPEEAEGLLSLAQDCGLDLVDACERMLRVADVMGTWRDLARRNSIGEREITMMAESIEPRREALIAAGTMRLQGG